MYCLLHEFTIESDPKTRLANALLREIPIKNAKGKIIGRVVVFQKISEKKTLSKHTSGQSKTHVVKCQL